MEILICLIGGITAIVALLIIFWENEVNEHRKRQEKEEMS